MLSLPLLFGAAVSSGPALVPSGLSASFAPEAPAATPLHGISERADPIPHRFSWVCMKSIFNHIVILVYTCILTHI